MLIFKFLTVVIISLSIAAGVLSSNAYAETEEASC